MEESREERLKRQRSYAGKLGGKASWKKRQELGIPMPIHYPDNPKELSRMGWTARWGIVETPSCKFCGSEETVRSGFKYGVQRYRCKSCGKNFLAEYKRKPPELLQEHEAKAEKEKSAENLADISERVDPGETI